MKKLEKTFCILLSFCLLFTVSASAQTLADGIKNLNAERYIEAGKIINQVAAADPSQENLFYQGYYLLKTMEEPNPEAIGKAKAIFTKANEESKKKEVLNEIGLGMVALANKDFAGAKATFEDAIKNSRGKDPQAYSKIATAYTMFDWANDPAEAIMMGDKALEITKDQNDPEPFIAKATAFLIKNEGGDAMNALGNALRIPGVNKADVYSTMARVWLQGKNYKEAEQAINNALEADPTHAPAYKYKSSFHQTYQQWDKAGEAALNYQKHSDGDCAGKLRYAKIAFIAKDYDNVLSTVNDIKSCSNDPILLRLEGISRFEKGEYNKAIELQKKYIETAPKDEVYGLDYGFISRSYMGLHGTDNANDELAIEYANKAYAAEDTTFSYYSAIADMYKEDKDYENSALYLEKEVSTKKKPTAEDYVNLGVLYMQLQDWEKADPVWDKVCELYKDSWAPAYFYSANVKAAKDRINELATYAGAERYEKYLSLLSDEQKALPANTDNVARSYKYLAGKAFLLEKDNNKALGYIDELLKFDPNNAEAQDLKDTINSPTGESVDSTGVQTGQIQTIEN